MRVKFHVATLALAALTGCGRNSGFLRDANTVNEHQFRMEIAAQRYARSVSGSSSIGSLFCIIPMSNGAYKDAMAALHAEAKLQMNEVIENIREDHAFIAYVFYCEDDLILSADVYQVTPASAAGRIGDEEIATHLDSGPPATRMPPLEPIAPPKSPPKPAVQASPATGDAGAPLNRR